MRKEAEEAESPKRSIRDSGYIDCWDSERSDSLSPPHHGREDSFDSLDSFGSRSRQTPSPDVLVTRGSSDGRGSDSESDGPPHRKMPDIRKDDMSARRTSISEPRTAMPFNQYLPNKSNQSGYMPTPLRKKKSDKEDGGRKSWSTATSPVGGDRPFSPNEIPSLDTPPGESPTPSPIPQIQIQKQTEAKMDEEEGEQSASTSYTEIHAAVMRRSSEPVPCCLAQLHAEAPMETVTHLVVTSEQSTPARSCSAELLQHSTLQAATSPVVSSGKNPPVMELEEVAERKEVCLTDAEQDAKSKCIASSSPSRVLPVPAAVATSTAASAATERRKGRVRSDSENPQGGTSWVDNPPATFSRTSSVSDDPASVSMIDMRGEEEATLPPHSQVRHELMHNQYNKMKEEDDHWQDDLARWKNRRRSISQDLIKKEEERKMMEQLMSGDSCPSVRRRSIKTYREIVEDKERREEELRDAYRRARTPEEASAILQRYAQRFSISEAVLERLQLPKLLDRSISADPAFPCSSLPLSLSSSPTTPDPFDPDPDGPMRYLRQQSAPAPKFTSTLEARIEEFPKDSSYQRPQIRSRSSEPPITRGLSPKPVPLLTPKPYFQSRSTTEEPWPSKADGLLRVNGDIGRGDTSTTSDSQGSESPLHFQASPSIDSDSAGAAPTSAPAAAQGPKVTTRADSPVEAQGVTGTTSDGIQEENVIQPSVPPSRPNSLPSELQKPESFGKIENHTVDAPEAKSEAAAQETPAETKQKQDRLETEQSSSSSSSVQSHVVNTQQSQPVVAQASVPASSEMSQEKVPRAAAPGAIGYNPPLETTAAEMEKECHGNEKYQREQEKLKEEWEKAQREVAEEERKYHEEERRILEETVTPLTPRSSALTSPSRGELSSASEPHDTIVRSLADWERKQELLERQSRGSSESVEWKQRKNDRTSDISTTDDSMKTGRSLMSQSSSQAEAQGHSLQNGQRLPPVPAKASTPVRKQQEATGDSSRPSRPAGDRRIGSIDNNMGRISSKPPAACPDTMPPAPNRSVSGKKLCSSCGQPLGKGAAMIIETLSLYFHIQCFKCGVCKGQLGDTTTGTDVRIRNGLLNCHQCYIRSRSAGQPTTL